LPQVCTLALGSVAKHEVTFGFWCRAFAGMFLPAIVTWSLLIVLLPVISFVAVVALGGVGVALIGAPLSAPPIIRPVVPPSGVLLHSFCDHGGHAGLHGVVFIFRGCPVGVCSFVSVHPFEFFGT
jgi:hypothetical protein